MWVGLDGYSNNTVEQLGTESKVVNGVASYDAWFEMYPSGMVQTFNVSAGDTINASVQYSNGTNKYLLTLDDTTNGQHFSYWESSSGTPERSSAEWIAEAPSLGSTVEPLPLFGSVSFTNAWTTIDSITGPIDDSAWSVSQLTMSNTANSDYATASTIVDAGAGSSMHSSFTVYQTPEPSAFVLLAAGLVTLGFRRTRFLDNTVFRRKTP